jgi:hypothetical protein
MPAPKKKTMPAAKGSGKAFKAPTAAEYRRKITQADIIANPEQLYAEERKLSKIDVADLKRGAKAAKNPRPLSTVTRKSGSRSLNDDFEKGYIAGKQELAAFMRKQGMKKMGKKK